MLISCGILNEEIGEVIISGGTISEIDNKGTLTVNRGTINVGITNIGTATVTGGIINSGISNSGTLVVAGGEIKGTRYGINNTGTLTVTGGTISASDFEGIGVYNSSTGAITITGGIINATGHIGIGIKNVGTLTLGKNGAGMPNTEEPLITGEEYGVSNSGIFNFYDGKIVATNRPINGEVTETPEDYEVKLTEEGTVATLQSTGTFDNAIRVGEVYYDSLMTAVAVITNMDDKTGTIYINEDIPIDTTITIPEGVNITIAIKKGKQVVYSDVDVAIINNGTLTITDFVAEDSTGEYALLQNEDGVVIENNGRLIIGDEGIVGEDRVSPRIVGKQAVIGNEPERISGSLVSTEPITANIMPYTAYVSTPNNDKATLLREAETRYTPEEWTNEDVNATVDVDVIPMLNLYSAVEPEGPEAVVRVTKVWDDNENAKKHRPESVTVDIMNGEVVVATGVLNETNNWTYEEDRLPKYDDAEAEIEYTVVERETNENDLEYYEEGVVTDTEEQVEEKTIHVFTVTNAYKTIDADITTEVTKVAETEEITHKDDPVSYTIGLTSEINNYIGEGKVTIIDRLPYRIDLTKSDIAEGVYDDEAMTITWEEELPHINTFTSGTSHIVNITKQITVVYKNIDLTAESLINSVYGKVELYETEEEDEGTPIAEIPINVKGKVISKYIDKNTGNEIEESDELEQKIGTEYSVSPKEIAGYKCVETSENETGTVTEEDIEVVFYYDYDLDTRVTANVTKVTDTSEITHKDDPVSYTIGLTSEISNYAGGGKTILIDRLPYRIDLTKSDIAEGVYDDEAMTITWEEELPHINTFTSGESYIVNITKQITLVYKDIDLTAESLINSVYGKVELSEADATDEGTPTAVVPINVQGKVIVKHIDVVTNEEIVSQDEITGKIGTAYSTESKAVNDYEVVRTSDNVIGVITEEDTIVEYYYDKDRVVDVNIVVTKVWDDNENAKGHRPESVTIDIMKNNVVIATEVLNEANNWTYRSEILPKYNDAKERIEYTVAERETTEGDLEYYEAGVVAKGDSIIEENTIAVYPFTITNAYRRSETSIDIQMTKGANVTEITHKDDPIRYTISLTSEISNYIGEGKAIIIDRLPYKIDLSKSDIAGGVYDDEAMTITWEEELPHINTYKAGENYSVNIIKSITLVYKDIDLMAVSLVNGVYGKIELDDAEKEDEGAPTAVVSVNVKGQVTVKYIEKDTNNKLADDEVKSQKIGTEYTVSAKDIAGYKVSQVIGEEKGVITEEAKEITYVYEKTANGMVTVKYVEIVKPGMNGSEADATKDILDPIIIEGLVGEKYETEAKNFEYYKLVKNTDNVSGELVEEGDTVVYYYEKLDFNMAVSKTISRVVLNGKDVEVKDNNLVKIEIPTSNLKKTDLIVSYKIEVINKGEMRGKTKVMDQFPEGYEIVQADADWKLTAKGVLEAEVELNPGEKRVLELTFKWVNDEKYLGTKINTAKIANSENIANFDDTNNDDDIDTASVIISIKTGEFVSIVIGILITSSLGICGYMIVATVRSKGPEFKKIRFLH